MLKYWALLFAVIACGETSLPIVGRFPREIGQKPINTKWNATLEDKLKRELLLNYDKFTRPSLNGSATKVTFDPTVNHVELDEESGVFTIHGWLKMTWTDDKLRWNEDEYSLNQMHLADHEIWQPDIVPYNSATSSLDPYGDVNCIVNNAGFVIWVPPAVIKVFCDLDLRKWPFDSQNCMMKFGSWTYSGVQVDLRYSDEEEPLRNMLRNAEWQLIKMTRQRNIVKYACCNEPYVDVMYNITISRRSPTYKALIVTPITVVVLMTLATFWIPSASADKLYLGGTSAFVISLYLVYFTQKLPVSVGQTPLIVQFYSNSLYLVGFSMVISVIVLNLTRGLRSRPIPWIIKKYLNGLFGRVLLLNCLKSQASASKRSGEEESSDNRPVFAAEGQDMPEGQDQSRSLREIHDDWRLLAQAIDRISFIIYCFIFICFAIAYTA